MNLKQRILASGVLLASLTGCETLLKGEVWYTHYNPFGFATMNEIKYEFEIKTKKDEYKLFEVIDGDESLWDRINPGDYVRVKGLDNQHKDVFRIKKSQIKK